jgi:nitroimidazol reductase NimA-like FMN-containing flavoprotein (pyridoxamine 5'-phosphate oxidase superfamily)
MSSYGLDVLDRDACDELLATQRVGRVAVCLFDRPVVLPVVFGLLDGDIVFRTAPGTKLVAAALHRTVAFEIDAYDLDAHSGWSVDVVGTAEEIVHPDVLERAHALGLPGWAGEVRDRYVRIAATEVTGRRLCPDGPGSEGE